jgi:hypothetical protein
MTYVIGQTVQKIITIKDDSNVAILGLTFDDFLTLEAFSMNSFATTADVDVEEIDDGQYLLSFDPSTFGNWALHYVYSDLPTFREETFDFPIGSTAEIVVTTSGGTWTYAGDLTDPLQEIRFLIQDTDGDSPMFTDTEVAFAYGTSSSNTRRAAAYLVERLMARYAGMADTTELDLSVRASQLYDHAKDLLASLNNPFSGNVKVKPYAGGISESDILVGESNRDRVVGTFDRHNPFWTRTS